MTAIEILKDKEILNWKDVVAFFNGEIGRNKAYNIIAEVNCYNNRFGISGRCATIDFIEKFGLNPTVYGRVCAIPTDSAPKEAQTEEPLIEEPVVEQVKPRERAVKPLFKSAEYIR